MPMMANSKLYGTLWLPKVSSFKSLFGIQTIKLNCNLHKIKNGLLKNSLAIPYCIYRDLEEHPIIGTWSWNNVKRLIVSSLTLFLLYVAYKYRELRIRHSVFNSLCTSSKFTKDEMGKYAYQKSNFLETPSDDVTDRPESGLEPCQQISCNLSQRISQGNYGAVYKGQLNGRHVTVKKISVDQKCIEEKILNEINFLVECDSHENIVKYFCIERIAGEIPVTLLVLERCDCTLKDWVANSNDSRHIINIKPKELFYQTTTGVAFLHENKIIHRDMKPECILLIKLSKDQFRVKICDFGISQRIPVDGISEELEPSFGTVEWMPPEIMKSFVEGQSTLTTNILSTATDIFSLGCIFYYTLSLGVHPFGNNATTIQSNILSYTLKIRHEQLNDQYLGNLSVILAMLALDPVQRPPASAILKHHICWSTKTKLEFLVSAHNVSSQPLEGSMAADVIDNFDRHVRMIHYCEPFESSGWIRFLCPAVKTYVSGSGYRPKGYHGDLLSELLCAIRNMKAHYVGLSEDVKDAVGSLDDQFMEYWIARFPFLVDVVWTTFERLKVDKSHGLSEYYCQDYHFHERNVCDREVAFLKRVCRLHAANFCLRNMYKKLV